MDETAKYPSREVHAPVYELARRILAPLCVLINSEGELSDLEERIQAMRNGKANGNGHRPKGERCSRCGSALAGPQAIVDGVYVFVCPNCHTIGNGARAGSHL